MESHEPDTVAQAETLRWITLHRPHAEVHSIGAWVVHLGDEPGAKSAIIYPDGSYATVRLGKRKDKKRAQT